MKTTNKILLLTAVALALTGVTQAKADGALLSPRALGNQSHPVATANIVAASTTMTMNVMPSSVALLSARAQGNQITKVSGTNNDSNLVKLDYYTGGAPHANSQQSAPVYQIAPVK